MSTSELPIASDCGSDILSKRRGTSSMTIDFRSAMQRYPDQELVRISQNGEVEGLDPLAIAAALEELSSRGWSQEQAAATIAEVEAADANQIPYEDQGLSKFSRIVFLFLGFFAFPVAVLMAIVMGLFGYRKRSEQAWLSIGVGLIPVAIIVITLIALNPR